MFDWLYPSSIGHGNAWFRISYHKSLDWSWLEWLDACKNMSKSDIVFDWNRIMYFCFHIREKRFQGNFPQDSHEILRFILECIRSEESEVYVYMCGTYIIVQVCVHVWYVHYSTNVCTCVIHYGTSVYSTCLLCDWTFCVHVKFVVLGAPTKLFLMCTFQMVHWDIHANFMHI